jgi:hypothetical protein
LSFGSPPAERYTGTSTRSSSVVYPRTTGASPGSGTAAPDVLSRV